MKLRFFVIVLQCTEHLEGKVDAEILSLEFIWDIYVTSLGHFFSVSLKAPTKTLSLCCILVLFCHIVFHFPYLILTVVSWGTEKSVLSFQYNIVYICPVHISVLIL